MKYVALVVVCCAVGLLAGCGNDESTTGTGGSLTPITVTGKVIGANKQPVSGVPVLIAGIPSVNTDPNGNFSIANVGRPYTITVIDAANKQAILYRGLTRSDPTLIFLGSNPGVKKVASLTGRIFPSSSYPEPATRKTLVGFVSTETGRTTTATPATGLYTLSNAEWYGPSTTTGTLHALQYDYNTSTGLPTTYVGYGVRSGIALLDATSNPERQRYDVRCRNHEHDRERHRPCRVYDLRERPCRWCSAIPRDSTCCRTTIRRLHSPMRCPISPGPLFRIGVIATKASTGSTMVWKANVAGNATGVTVTVPGAPELSLPINAATNVTTSTPFSWTQYTGGVHLLIYTGGASKPSYLCPDLRNIGLDPQPLVGRAGTTGVFGLFVERLRFRTLRGC